MRLIDYVRQHLGEKDPHFAEEERTIYKLLKEDPEQTSASLARKTKLKKHVVQVRLRSLVLQKRIKYVRMWVPLDEIDEE
ncbi:hypothetical protein M0R72_11240 [Candidatus Pacearchaeota archaeon]|nr:hypothetical protein [Candidatus Pacearchaeota archaeon]